MDLGQWNKRGRGTNARVCEILDDVIDRGKPGKPFPADDREKELADAVLAEVVALNAAGRWQEARAKFDPAHAPFVGHMEGTVLQGITQAVFLGPDAFLVRLGDETQDVQVFHLEGGKVEALPGVLGFCISRDRRHLALATRESVLVYAGWKGEVVARMPWPDDKPICPWRMSVSDDGTTVTLGNDALGLWLCRQVAKQKPKWVKLAPRDGLLASDEADEDEDQDDDEDEDEDDGDTIDVLHAAISPDGGFVALGWQDAPGHVIEKIGDDLSLERWAMVEPRSDYPYHVLFTDDSSHALFNSRHMQSGVTVYASLSSLKGLGAYEDLPDDCHDTDEYLRAYGMVLLPKEVEAQNEPVAWIGGQGWSHAAPLSGGKPAFTHLFGSSLHAFDYDPASKRALVGSASGMLHVLDPFARADEGTAQGYHPRRELYRWIFWDTLKHPIRW
jgi:hypothetical protein